VSAFAPLALGALAGGVGLGGGLVVCAGFFLCAAIVMTFLPNLRSAAPVPALST
jgi:hypothetical protein